MPLTKTQTRSILKAKTFLIYVTKFDVYNFETLRLERIHCKVILNFLGLTVNSENHGRDICD
jgi:hypothetical protein